jgi:hypothetical protein
MEMYAEMLLGLCHIVLEQHIMANRQWHIFK